MYKIRLENTITHNIYEKQVQDRNNGDKLYYHFAMSTLDLEDGEYILTLFDADDNVLAEDLLRIGDFNLDTLQYTKGENIYINVNLDATLEKKRSVINNIDTTIYPNELVDGMTDVQINAQPLYDTAKNEGYENGFTIGNQEGYTNGYAQGNQDGYVNGKADGVSEQKSKLESINITENGVYSNEDGYNHIEVNVPDLNGSYDEGKEDGIKEQKSKLKTINITENGTYSREDGYNSITVEVADLNGSYDEGYKDGYDEGVEEGASNAGGAIAETARVLNVTENGVYTSEYTQDGDIVINSNQQITGVYDDGTNFYDTAELFCSYVQLDVIPTEETRIELWYLPNMPHMGDGFHRVLHSKNEQISFVFDGGGVNNKTLRFIFGDKNMYYTPSNIGDEWWHIILDKNGLIFNGEEFPFDATATFSKTEVDLCINGGSDMGVVSRLANGTYGMVKIDDTTYIPYEGGFLNTNTDVLQPIIQPNLAILEDGTPITKATYLNGAVFDTGLKITEDSTIELWINKYERDARGYYLYSDLFSVRRDDRFWYVNTTSLYSAESYRNYFEHITISKADGFVVEDGDGTHTLSLDSINFSSGNETIKIRTDNANFAYGLLKINGNIIVPSEDGFTNLTTNEPLRRCEEWGGTFEYKNAFNRYYSNEITIQREGTLIRSVNVNVVPKIKVANNNLKFAYSSFDAIPEWADFKGVVNMQRMFQSCPILEVRMIDTSSVTDMSHCFYNCSNLKQIATLDTSNVTTMEGMCNYCGQLIEFPPLNTIRVTNMREMFRNCNSLKKVPALDARSVVKQSYGLFGLSNNLTDFGGLIGLKASIDGNYGFEKVPNLTYESCINILNGLFDFTGNGVTPTSNEGKLKVHSNFLTVVGDEINIGTAKGWTITA
jgi:surface protein